MGYQIFFTCGFITNLGIYNTSEWSCSNVSDIQRKHSHISHISCCCHCGMFSPHTKMILNLTRPSVCIGAIFFLFVNCVNFWVNVFIPSNFPCHYRGYVHQELWPGWSHPGTRARRGAETPQPQKSRVPQTSKSGCSKNCNGRGL